MEELIAPKKERVEINTRRCWTWSCMKPARASRSCGEILIPRKGEFFFGGVCCFVLFF